MVQDTWSSVQISPNFIPSRSQSPHHELWCPIKTPPSLLFLSCLTLSATAPLACSTYNSLLVPNELVFAGKITHYLFIFFFFFSSTSLLLPTRDPPPSCIHAQSCNPMDYSQPGSSVHGLFQERILEWVAISFSTTISFLRSTGVYSSCSSDNSNKTSFSAHTNMHTDTNMFTKMESYCLYVFWKF